MESFAFRKDRNSRIFLCLFCVALLGVIFRLYYLQVVKVSYYRQISEKNCIKPLPLVAPRGLISDRNGKILVSNFPSYTLLIMPGPVKNIRKTIDQLASFTRWETTNLADKIEDSWPYAYQPIRIKRSVDFSTLCVLEERNEDLPGIYYQVELDRKYPSCRWSGHLLGYVSEISLEELRKSDKQRSGLGDLVGKEGLEKRYDDLLKGQKGTRYMEVSATGKILGELEDKEPVMPVPGVNIELTIDLDLQAFAESAFYPYRSGALVAMDPKSGEILAMLSKPGFDSNIFSGILTEKEWERLASDPDRPFLNRAIQGLYPPGSTLKVLTAAAALEEEIIDQKTYLSPCYGFFFYGDRVFRCWQEGGHGKMNVIDALVHSCDVYFYQLGLELGLDKWCWYADRCGLDRRTGIDLPDEKEGLIPSLEYYHRKFGQQRWIKNLVINLSIGQGEILLTPLQVATFYCGLVNDGWEYQPRLLKRVVSEQRATSYGPEVLRRLPFSSETLEILKKAMAKSVADPSGTGHLARIQGINVGGKTGTAQNPHGKDHAWFVGFAPVEDPGIVVAVMIEKGGHGGELAAPLARQVILKYMQKESQKLAEK